MQNHQKLKLFVEPDLKLISDPGNGYSVDLTGEIKPGGFMANTAHLNCSRIVSAVLPINNPAMPVRATVPITTISACNCFAAVSYTHLTLPTSDLV